MKKILLSAVVVTMSLFSFNAMAHGKQCDKKDCQKETCDKHKKCDKMEKTNCTNPFVGIELTKAQQEKLEALKASCPIKVNKKADRKKFHQYRDSIARDAKVKHLAEVKKILTPEQYVQFLENMVLNSPKKAPKHGHHGMHKGKKCPPMHQDCPMKK
jgi:hypothetical protein